MSIELDDLGFTYSSSTMRWAFESIADDLPTYAQAFSMEDQNFAFLTMSSVGDGVEGALEIASMSTEQSYNSDTDGDGFPDPDMVVTAKKQPIPTFWFSYGGDGGGGGGGGTGGLIGVNLKLPTVPNCSNSNPIIGITAPDGARYLVPQDVTAEDLSGAVIYINNLAATEGKVAVIKALHGMYEVPTHPHFVDFKDWGTVNGPAESVGAGNIFYMSQSLGRGISANAFEPFGNYFFGLLCTMGGLSPEETWAVAALTQSGRLGELASGDPTRMLVALAEAALLGDDLTDRPFVTDGIGDAQAYRLNPHENGNKFSVDERPCGSS